MAIAQRQLTHGLQRPAARTVVLPELPARGRISARAMETNNGASLVIFGAAALALVAYVSGYARMTGVNYQRVQIRRQISSLQTQEQLLQTELIRRSQKEAVQSWATANHMTPPAIAPVVLQSRIAEAR